MFSGAKNLLAPCPHHTCPCLTSVTRPKSGPQHDKKFPEPLFPASFGGVTHEMGIPRSNL